MFARQDYPRRKQLDTVPDDEGDEPPEYDCEALPEPELPAEASARAEQQPLGEATPQRERGIQSQMDRDTPEKEPLVQPPATAERVARYHRTVDAISRALEEVEPLQEPRVLVALQGARHRAEKRVRGADEGGVATRALFQAAEAEAVAEASRETALQQSLAALRDERAELRVERARLEESRRVTKVSLSAAEDLAVLRNFSLADLGAGHPEGGTADQFQNRRVVLERMLLRGSQPTAQQRTDFTWFQRAWDEEGVRAHGADWAATFMAHCHDVLRRMASGRPDAVLSFMRDETQRVLGAMPVVRV